MFEIIYTDKKRDRVKGEDFGELVGNQEPLGENFDIALEVCLN